jgi:uncharacterized protein (DUF302 family)
LQQSAYTVESSKGFEETAAAVEAKSKEKGFNILAVRDVKAAFRSKGFSRDRIKVIELCSANYVDHALAKDLRMSLVLPCPVIVYMRAGKTYICMPRRRTLADCYRAPGTAEIADDIDRIVTTIVDEAR